MFNRVNAVVLFVQDFATSLAFYRDTLELPVIQLEEKFAAFKMHEQDFAINEITPAAQMVNVAEAEFTPLSGGVHRVLLCARVENVDAAYETLLAKGVPFTLPPTDQYWGLRTAFFKDPEGNLWEIAQPLNPQD